MRCAQCGHIMEQTEGTHRYDESGLKNIFLVNVPIHKCPNCGESEVEIPCMDELHSLLAFLVLLEPERLTGEEVRFLRKHLGYSQEELATAMGVTRITVTRWESGKNFRLEQDKHLRRLYLAKAEQDLKNLPEVKRILSALVDRLPLGKKKERRIRKEEWIHQADDQRSLV